MELWMKYALVAAVFIAIRDIFSSKIARKYNYIDYIVHANIFVLFSPFFLTIILELEHIKFSGFLFSIFQQS